MVGYRSRVPERRVVPLDVRRTMEHQIMLGLRDLVRWLVGEPAPQPGPAAEAELVRPGFISSRPLFNVSDELVRKLEEAGAGDRIQDPVKGPLDVFLLDPGLGPATFLTRDGCVVWEDDWGVAPIMTQAYAAIIVGAKKTGVRELLDLLPVRSDACEDCGECRGSGWLELGAGATETSGLPFRIVCTKCGGLGFRRDVAQLPAEVAAWVAARIEAYADEAPESLRWLAPYVDEHRALPLLVGWTSTAAIKPDGSLVWWSTEGEYESTRPVDEAHDRHIVLAVASKRYPELASVVPVRPEDALMCSGCGGAGGVEGAPEVICMCGGLGWTRRSSKGRRT